MTGKGKNRLLLLATGELVVGSIEHRSWLSHFGGWDGVGVYPLTLVSCWLNAVPGDISFLAFPARTRDTQGELC